MSWTSLSLLCTVRCETTVPVTTASFELNFLTLLTWLPTLLWWEVIARYRYWDKVLIYLRPCPDILNIIFIQENTPPPIACWITSIICRHFPTAWSLRSSNLNAASGVGFTWRTLRTVVMVRLQTWMTWRQTLCTTSTELPLVYSNLQWNMQFCTSNC